MAGEFFPRREAELYSWSANVATQLLARPEEYPLRDGVAEAFAAVQARYAQAYTRASRPETATRAANLARREARAAMIAQLRRINGQLRANACLGVTPALLVNLGLDPRGRGGHSPRLPRPESAPTVALLWVRGQTARVRLLASGTDRRGRPRGVAGANLYWHAGTDAPTALGDWKFLMDTGRTRLTIRFPAELPPGARVWVVARWKNPRLQCGPPSIPLHFNLPGGLTMPLPQGVRVARAA
jgi:hypothetical protein